MLKKTIFDKIFIACPISKFLVGRSFTDEHFKSFIEDMYALCNNYADEVFMALKREQYGKKLMTEQCAIMDIEEMSSANLVIAIPDDSMGVAIELGWACVLKKETLLLLDSQKKYSPLLTGMGAITKTTCLYYDSKLDDEVIYKTKAYFDTITL